jgi:hypothetical protein
MAMNQKRHDGQWGTAKRYSVFAYHPREFTPEIHSYTKISLVQYCQNKNISRDQAKTLIKRHWLAVTRLAGRLWVHEVCPEQIAEFLDIWPPCKKEG